MKKLNMLLCLVLILSGLICLPSAFAEIGDIDEDGYMEIIESDSQYVHLNIKSVEDRGEYVIAWTKHIPKGEMLSEWKKLYGADLHYELLLSAYNKKYKQSRLITSTGYSASGKVLNTYQYNDIRWTEIIPESIGDGMYVYVMLVFNHKK